MVQSDVSKTAQSVWAECLGWVNVAKDHIFAQFEHTHFNLCSNTFE